MEIHLIENHFKDSNLDCLYFDLVQNIEVNIFTKENFKIQ